MYFIQLILTSFKTAMQEMRRNFLRTILSLLGIAIGIFCVIIVFSVIDSLKYSIEKSLQSIGNDVVFVEKWPWEFDDPNYAWWDFAKRPNPNYSELQALESQITLAKYCAISVKNDNIEVQHIQKKIEVNMEGVTANYDKIFDLNIVEGRFFSQFESIQGQYVMIIGNDIAEQLFVNSEQVVQNTLSYKGNDYKILGKMGKQGQNLLGSNIDKSVIIPYNTIIKTLKIDDNDMNMSNVQLMVKAKEKVHLQDLKDQLIQALRSKRHLKPLEKNNFALNQMSMLSHMVDGIFRVINSAGWLIGFFALLVGGVGIANIMFVSVQERTKFIGIKKSLGAKNYFILFEFIFEAILLSILGGLLGVILVWIMIILINYFQDTFKLILTFKNILRGVLTATIIGLISGFLPARRASRLSPIEAMRQ